MAEDDNRPAKGDMDDENGPDAHRDSGKYRVGKGKPPLEHRFQPGGKPGPGRPRGSRKRSESQSIFDERVKVGEDRLGRPIYKTWRQVIDTQLLKKVAEGEFRAIKLMKDFELRLEALSLRYGPPPPTAADRRKEEEKKKIGEQAGDAIRNLLNIHAHLKQLGCYSNESGRLKVADWLVKAAEEHSLEGEPMNENPEHLPQPDETSLRSRQSEPNQD